jgi:hypothetical protein
MSVTFVQDAIRSWVIAQWYEENGAIDLYISTVIPAHVNGWSKKNQSPIQYTTYNDLHWDFSQQWTIAQLLKTNLRIVLIIDTFPIHHLKPLLPLLAKRKATTHIWNPNTGRSWLITLWIQQDYDTVMFLEHGIDIYEPATYEYLENCLPNTWVQYIKTGAFPLPKSIPWRTDANEDIVLWWTSPLIDPQMVIIASWILLYEATIIQNQLIDQGVQTELFIWQKLTTPKISESLYYACKAAQRCTLLMDQTKSEMDVYFKHLLPSEIAEQVAIRLLCPDFKKITTHYEESIQSQTQRVRENQK